MSVTTRNYKRIMTLVPIAILAIACTACGARRDAVSETGAGEALYEETDTNAAEKESVLEEYSDEGVEDSGNEEISISQEELTLLYGRGTNLDVYGTEGKIQWENSDPDAVDMEEYDDYVMVTGKAAGKEATITATASSGESVSCQVKVISVGLYLMDDRGNAGAYSSGTYGLGKKHVYTAFYDGAEIPASDLQWESMDETVAKVSDGTVEMTGEGVTYIRATDQRGNTAYAGIWVSDTDDEYEYETKTPGKGLFLEMFLGCDEHLLEGYEGESQSFALSAVYDDGEEVDTSLLEWSIEDQKGHPIDILPEETDGEQVTVVYTQEAGQAFLVATNPSTGHQFRYLIQAIDGN